MWPSPAPEPPAAAGRERDTRQRLLLAAVHLFQQRGYHGVGTAEILASSRAPRGSLYHHFPGGKQELACAAIAWVTGEIIAFIQKLRLEGAGPADVVERMAETTGTWLERTEYRQSGLLAALTAGLGEGDEALATAIDHAYARIQAEYHSMFAVAGMQGAVAGKLARATIVAAEGALVLARARRDVDILTEQMMRVAADIRGVMKHL